MNNQNQRLETSFYWCALKDWANKKGLPKDVAFKSLVIAMTNAYSIDYHQRPGDYLINLN